LKEKRALYESLLPENAPGAKERAAKENRIFTICAIASIPLAWLLKQTPWIKGLLANSWPSLFAFLLHAVAFVALWVASYFVSGVVLSMILVPSPEDTSKEQRQQLEAAEQARKEALAAKLNKNHTPQVKEVLDRGDAYIAEIRRCNDLIPGQEISGKISRMEIIVEKIFDRAEAHPEIIPDLKKMMDYYLPMTVKLLNAYADMDAQPIQGETIRTSKQEIEDSLDTLNLAFEKLLDQVFADTALDVSSDISVLNTLLAQEGLTEDELTKMRKS
jgi:5-bromo-4-chloroindolyl phosphate hydrolysis protein